MTTLSKPQIRTVNGMKVTTFNITASNGAVHIIEGVLIPPTRNVSDILVEQPKLSDFNAMVEKTGLNDLLASS